MQNLIRISAAASLFAFGAGGSSGGTFSTDFNNGTPAGATVYGHAVVDPTGGVNNSGVLKLTTAATSQSGSMILDDLDGGTPIYGFDMRFKARVGGGTATPADGFSVNFGPDLSEVIGEEGAGSGLRVVFDLYDNGGGEAPAIDIKIGDTVIASRKLTIPEITTGADFADVHIEMKPDGILNLAYKGMVIHTNLVVAGYQPTWGQFGFGGRTGGSTANQWIDDLQVTTHLQPQSAIAQQPASVRALQGRDVTFSVQITNPDGVTYQWFRNGTALPGATDSSLVVPAVSASDSGARFHVQVTGPNNTITSDEATLTVVDIPSPTSPKIAYNFNDGLVPPGAGLLEFAFVDSFGGVNDGGVLKLTMNENDYRGGFLIEDPDAGAPVYGLTAQFNLRIGGGTTPPADGLSFNLTTNVPDPLPTELEEGIGGDLSVVFDIYDNGGGEAPAIDIKWGGQVVASAKVPRSFIETGDEFAEALIRLEPDGTMDVAFRGVLVHENVVVPGFSSISGGRYVFAARTGGANANHWVDDIQIATVLTPGALRISADPVSQTVLAGRPVTFIAQVNDPAGTTFQWLKNDAPVNGATSATLTLDAAAVADNGAVYQLRATKGGVTVTSAPATLTVVDLAAPTAPTIAFDFNDGQIPQGTAVFGNAFVDSFGGVNDSGVLKVTINENSQTGAFVVEPLLGGAEVSTMIAAFDLRLGGGSGNPADGISFNFAPDLPLATAAEGENGAGTGLSIGFDIYDNGGGEAPAIEVKYKGTVISSTKMTKAEIETGDDFRQVLVRLTPEGKVDLAYGDRVIHNGLQLSNYTFIANGRFGFYGRTGGENENQWVDNIRIEVTKSTAPLRITDEPADVITLSGSPVTFSVTVSDPNGATYQWFRNGAAIANATNATLTVANPTSDDNGARFSVRVTGPGGTVTSRDAVATVVAPITVVNPIISFNFDDGLQPENTTIGGTAYLDGVALRLTDAENGLSGSFVIGDRNNGEPVSGFVASFRVHVGNGTVPPADGFSFVWGQIDDPFAAFGEDGTGNGLVVSFDVYDNGGGEAPAIDIIYAGEVMGTYKVPFTFLDTGFDFVDVVVRVEPDGTLDLVYNGTVVYHNLQLRGYAPQAGASFGFGGRTGGLNVEQWIDDVRIATSTGAAPPTVTISKAANGAMTITWTGGGTLQARDSLDASSPWTPVAGATSPYSVPNDRAVRFFRVAQ